MAITIQTFMISNDLSKISLQLEVNAGETANKLLFWNQDTYKDPSQQVDLTSKLAQTSNVESIEITAEDINESNLTGLYVIQVETSDGEAALVGTASFTQYYIIQAKLLATIDLSCLNCNATFQNALLFDLYLTATIKALELGRFQDAIMNLAKLKVIQSSSDCSDCNNIEPLVSTAGNIVSVGIIDCQLASTE